MKDERIFWLGFSVFPGIGPGKFKILLKHFGTAKDAWGAPKKDLEEILGEKLTENLNKFRNDFSPLDYFKKLKKENVWFLTLQDREYPELLAKITNPPFVLYGKGSIQNLGSRHSRVADDARQTVSNKNSVNTRSLSENRLKNSIKKPNFTESVYGVPLCQDTKVCQLRLNFRCFFL